MGSERQRMGTNGSGYKYLGKVLMVRRVFWEHEVAGSTPAT